MSEFPNLTLDAPQVLKNRFNIQSEVLHGNSTGLNAESGLSMGHPFKSEAIPDEAIIKELECILESPDFKDKAMLRGFLTFVVEETLAGRSHEIKGYTVATQVFGRRSDFDPTIDPIVRIQAGRLRRTLAHYYTGYGKWDPLRIEIGKGSYIPNFSRTIPEKLRILRSQKPDGMILPEEKPPQSSAENTPCHVENGASIAVMPLVNLTGDPDQGCMADGLTEELMIELAHCPALRVNASHSTTQWKGKPIGARAIGRKLGVRFFLEGSLRKEERNIKFNLRLIDTSTGMQIWGEQYKRSLESNRAIGLQEEIAQGVAGRIGGVFGIIPRKLFSESRMQGIGNINIYEAFFRFSQYQIELSPRGHANALEALEHVMSMNPESGLTLSMLSCLFANQYAFFNPEEKDLLDRALEFARQGLLLEPENQLARILLAYVLFVSGQKETFFREAEELLSLHPNSPDCIAPLGWAISLYGEWERGLYLLEKGLELNPFYPGWFRLAPYLNYCRHGRFGEALKEAENFNTPKLFWDPLLRAVALAYLGRDREAASAVKKIIELNPDFCSCGPESIRIFIKESEVREILFVGLRKAGLRI